MDDNGARSCIAIYACEAIVTTTEQRGYILPRVLSIPIGLGAILKQGRVTTMGPLSGVEMPEWQTVGACVHLQHHTPQRAPR